MNTFREITGKLPEGLARELKGLPEGVVREVEEIRFRCGQPIRLQCGMRERVLGNIISQEDLHKTLNNLIQYSYYAYEDDLAKGFVTIEGGHRVGICGKVVIKQGRPGLIKEISSLNIRFAKEIRGCSQRIIPEIIGRGGGSSGGVTASGVGGPSGGGALRGPCNTLIISPPGCGKTTLLRDMARALSESRYKVAICDDRSELAGMYHSKPSFDLGPRCDVLDGCEKAWGIPMLIRSMSPQVIITDEIGKPEDLKAARQCLVSGVTLITSIHGNCREDVERSAIGSLIEQGFFEKLIYLTNTGGVGSIRAIEACRTVEGARRTVEGARRQHESIDGRDPLEGRKQICSAS